VDVQRLVAFIAVKNPAAARKMKLKLFSGLSRLSDVPELGRPGQQAGIRELIVPPYVAVYRITSGYVEILNIYHCNENWILN
jgi:toxin ParE1/3/4